MGRWIGPVLVIAVVTMVAPVASASGSAPAAPFSGLFSIDEAVRVTEGADWRDVGTSLLEISARGNDAPLRPHAEIDRAVLHVAQTSWQTDARHRPVANLTDATWHVESYEIEGATMHTATSDAARWIGVTPYLPHGLPTANLSTCSAAPGLLGDGGLPVALEPLYVELGGWDLLPPTVVDRLTPPTSATPLFVECQLQGDGELPLSFLVLQDAHIVFEQDQAKRVPVGLLLDAGHRQKANTSHPWIIEHTLRFGVLDARGERPMILDANGAASSATTLRLWTPSTTLEASINIPKSHGTAQWGSIHANGTLDALRPTGALTLSSPSDHQIAFEGIAWDVEGLTIPTAPHALESAVAAGIVAGAAGLAVAAVVRLVRRLAPAGLALYSRLDEKQAAEHPRRQRILECVRHDPGITVHDVVDRTGLSRRAVDYHVGILTREGLLSRRAIARRKALFPQEVANPSEQVRLHLAKRDQYHRLLSLILDHPALSQREIGRRLGVSQPHVSRLLQRLRDLGAVEVQDQDGERRYDVLIHPEANTC